MDSDSLKVTKPPCPCFARRKSINSDTKNENRDSKKNITANTSKPKMEIFDETLKKEIFVEASKNETDTERFRRKIFDLDKINCQYHRAKEMCDFIEQGVAIFQEYVDWLDSVIEEAKRLRNIHMNYLLGQSQTGKRLHKAKWYQFSRNFLAKEAIFNSLFSALCSQRSKYDADVTKILCMSKSRDDSMASLTDEPKFAEPIPNVTVALGRDAALPCVVENLGEYKIRAAVTKGYLSQV
ncbi:hypothetical protein M8J75_009571 [Diaphorina citri]|nr:hypothetical protein M8J75_009571 [Diaphorina citri]